MGELNIDLTEQLKRWKAGDKAAENILIEALYPQLKRSALGALSKCAPGRLSLSATELVHETYLRLVDQRNDFENRAHFMAIAAQTLKRVLLDLIKARQTEKHGAAVDFIALELLDPNLVPDANQNRRSPIALVAAFQRLEQLSNRDPIAANVLELRLLGGLTNDEAAFVLKIGVATATRHFAFARAWLGK
jgi:RNA polymerase sigma factor (TIGR02999 family)